MPDIRSAPAPIPASSYVERKLGDDLPVTALTRWPEAEPQVEAFRALLVFNPGHHELALASATRFVAKGVDGEPPVTHALPVCGDVQPPQKATVKLRLGGRSKAAMMKPFLTSRISKRRSGKVACRAATVGDLVAPTRSGDQQIRDHVSGGSRPGPPGAGLLAVIAGHGL